MSTQLEILETEACHREVEKIIARIQALPETEERLNFVAKLRESREALTPTSVEEAVAPEVVETPVPTPTPEPAPVPQLEFETEEEFAE